MGNDEKYFRQVQRGDLEARVFMVQQSILRISNL